jgi:3'-phosphoadenosine 5'-phosphosulfate (PAPS) 3'-phosphatase
VLAGKNSIYIEQIIGIAHEAGKIILKIYNSDNYNQVEKSDFSPLTKADIESHNIIVTQLQKITSAVPILSEEGKLAKKIVNSETSIIKVKRNEQNKKLIIVGSRSHTSKELIEFCNQYNDYNLISMGSSIKLCKVADGTADIYPGLGLTSEWDIADAHAVVDSAKGKAINLTTKEPIR